MNLDDIILTIGIPTHDAIKSKTVGSLFAAVPRLPSMTRLSIRNSCYIHDSRNKIARGAIESGSTHLLFLDSDIIFPSGAVAKLISENKEIIGGLYYKREKEERIPLITIEENKKLVVPKNFNKEEPFKVSTVATGFMLIKTSVFSKIPAPWFSFEMVNGRQVGEDVSFCLKAGKVGVAVWCDPTLNLKHIGEFAY